MPKQPLSSESDAKRQGEQVRPIRSAESDIAGRLKSLISDEPHVAFARRVGIGETTLRKYLAGADPSATRLVRIAETAGVSLEWLATGKGPRKPVAASAPAQVVDDLERLQLTVAAVEKGLRAIGRQLPPEKYAELVVAAYQLMGAPSASSAQIIQFIKAAR